MNISFLGLVGIAPVPQITLKAMNELLRAGWNRGANIVHVEHLNVYCIYIQYTMICEIQGSFSTEFRILSLVDVSNALIYMELGYLTDSS